MTSDAKWEPSPCLGVRDVRKGAEYLQTHLGFTINSIESPASETDPVYAIVSRSGCELHLQIRRRPLWSGARQEIELDAYIRVPDVDAVWADFSARGAQILRPPCDQAYGMRDCVVAGPEGYCLAFGSALPKPGGPPEDR